MDVCPQGHQITSSADRDGQGYCLACRRLSVKAYRTRQSVALQLATELEAQGLQVTRSDPPVDPTELAAALATGYAIRKELMMTDPQVLRQMLIEALTAGYEANQASKPKADDGPDLGAEFAKFIGEHLNNEN